mmetsp:Transcript_4158/g.12507  ORF Transcript_4158/g.12507 Transcript_4158/m.12507 type:complete len:99 (+) Transcript_4158:1816-2112(+)
MYFITSKPPGLERSLSQKLSTTPEDIRNFHSQLATETSPEFTAYLHVDNIGSDGALRLLAYAKLLKHDIKNFLHMNQTCYFANLIASYSQLFRGKVQR